MGVAIHGNIFFENNVNIHQDYLRWLHPKLDKHILFSLYAISLKFGETNGRVARRINIFF